MGPFGAHCMEDLKYCCIGSSFVNILALDLYSKVDLKFKYLGNILCCLTVLNIFCRWKSQAILNVEDFNYLR